MSENPEVVLISGGSRGLGRALVGALLGSGRVVATFSRSPTPFVEERQRSDPSGERFTWEAIDATDHEQTQRFALALARRHGRIDVLINNAGVAVDGVLPLARASDIHRTIAVNLEAAIHLAQVCSRVMLRQEAGCMINVSSIVGLRGYTGLAAYSATKAALDGLTRSLARELGPRGIRVNAVAPGFLDTDLSERLTADQREQVVRRTPLGRLGTVDDVVGVIEFLMSPAARFITGQTLVVDGGVTC